MFQLGVEKKVKLRKNNPDPWCTRKTQTKKIIGVSINVVKSVCLLEKTLTIKYPNADCCEAFNSTN